MITDTEYNTISCTASDYTLEISKTNKHLADALFAAFDHEFRRLSRYMSDFMECKYVCDNQKWYHLPNTKWSHKVDMEIASDAVDAQKDAVDSYVEALRMVAEMCAAEKQ